MSQSAFPSGIRRALTALENRILAVLLLFGFGRTLVSGSGLLVALFVLDRLFEPPSVVRLILLLSALIVLGGVAVRYLLKPLRHRPLPRDLAAIWERQHPELGDRFATAVELTQTPPGTSADLLQEVRRQADELTTGLDPKQAVPIGRARRSSLAGMGAVLLLVAATVAFPQQAGLFFARLFGSDQAWPRDTTLVLLAPHLDGQSEAPELIPTSRESFRLEAAYGSVITLRVRAEGVVPDQVVAKGGDFLRTMRPLGGGEFVLRMPPLREDLSLSFQGGDDDDGRPRLRMLPGHPPAVVDWQVQVEPPAYTGRPPENSTMNEFRLPQGSRLVARFQTDRPVALAQAVPVQGAPEILQQDDQGFWVLEADTRRSGEAVVQLEGTDGFRDNRAAVLRWHAMADRPPSLQFLLPATTWSTLAGGQVPILLEAEDDFGLEALLLATGEEAEPKALDFPESARKFRHFQSLILEAAPEDPEGSSFRRLRLRAWARDKAAPEPHQSQADSPWIEVLPPDSFEARLREQMKGVRSLVERLLERVTELESANASKLASLARRIRRDLNGLQGQLEEILLQQIFAGVDQGSAPAVDQLGQLFLEEMPESGEITATLAASQPLLDRSGRILDLSRATLGARQEAAAQLELALREGKDWQPPARQLKLQLQAMLLILQAWEDFQSTVNLLRELLDRQRALYLRTKEASDG
ncbi:MAG: hypothetical protein DWQ01_18890 [Planctomycetota bacterium]|nr:MAG: hypothetical protein DWQ01_18890 [Planctomycetota bacterium]